MPTVVSNHLPIAVDIDTGPTTRTHRGQTKLSFKKANRARFAELASRELSGWDANALPSLDSAVQAFNDKILSAAACIPKGALPHPKGWWSPQCKAAKDRMQAAHAALRNNPGDAEAARIAALEARAAERVFHQEKERSWNEFVSALDSKTPSTRVRDVIRSLDGRGKQPEINSPLHDGVKTVYSDRDKAALYTASYAATTRVSISREDGQEAYKTVRAYLN